MLASYFFPFPKIAVRYIRPAAFLLGLLLGSCIGRTEVIKCPCKMDNGSIRAVYNAGLPTPLKIPSLEILAGASESKVTLIR